MKLNIGAMLRTLGIGLVIELVKCGEAFGIGQVYPTSAMEPQQFFTTGYGLRTDLGLSLCCVGFLLYGVTGTTYGWFANRDQGTVDVGQTALGGGITTAIVSAVTFIISMVISTLYVVAAENTTGEQIINLVNSRTDLMAMFNGLMVFNCCSALITKLILPAGFGAAGGTIYAAVAKHRQSQGAASRGNVMKLNVGAMLMAFGIGLVIELVVVAISEVMNAAPTVTAGTPPEPILLSRTVGIGLCMSCVVYLLYGTIYAWFARVDQGAIGAGAAALGGCITAAIVAVIGSVISMNLELWSGRFDQALVFPSGAIVGSISGKVFIDMLVGLCIASALSAGLGAAGGAIYAAIAGRGQSQGTALSV